ncbi:MAG: tail fiber domain-containing protein, partial [bacterium]
APTCAFFDGNVDVAGDLCATGTIGVCSDARYKKDVEDLECALSKVSALRGVTYRWRQDEFPKKNFDGNVHHGFIAQELQQVLPDAIHEDSQGYLSVDYSRVTPLLVEALKEQQKEIDELRTMIEQLLASK